MPYERWAKRMDDAVESTWLRSLRSQDDESRAKPRRFVPTAPGAKKPAGGLRDRTIAAGADR